MNRNIMNDEYLDLHSEDIAHQYKNLIESSTNGITVLQDGKWVFANEAALRMFGATKKEDLLGINIYEMLHQEFHDECKAILIKGGVHEKLYRVWNTLDNKELHTEVISIEMTHYGKPANQLIFQDITERKKMEKLVLEAEKMNVVAHLAAGIAHEIRNPLTSLKGFVQLFRAGTVPNETFLEIMENELERIDTVSTEFLALAKPADTEFELVDVKDVVCGVVELFGMEAFKKKITISKDLIPEQVVVEGIGAQLKQVFINLVKNAVEVMATGTLTITIKCTEKYAYVSVRDEGIGMSKKHIKRLGEPFFTTKTNGTGLGLMVTYKIIEDHHGAIIVDSQMGVGTTFTVKLPRIIE